MRDGVHCGSPSANHHEAGAGRRTERKQVMTSITERMPEAEAIEKARNGDVTGYESLYHLHRHRVYSLCLRFTGNASDAEDLAQEVFLQVYRKISTFRGDAKFGSWLHRVAVNLALMRFRRRRPREVSLNVPETLKPDPMQSQLCDQSSTSSFLVERVALGRALGSLSKAKRSVVLLHDVNGFTHGEVARRLGLAAGTSKSQLHKAHVELRDILGPREAPRNLNSSQPGRAATGLQGRRPGPQTSSFNSSAANLQGLL
jgi:RNA polymerase sigma-70 factor (ECF subfamily)